MSQLLGYCDAVLAAAVSVVGTGVVHGTALAVLTLILTRTVLRDARPALVSALWTVVLLKFLIPFGPEVPVSLSGALDALWSSDPQVAAGAHALPDAAAAAVAPAPTGLEPWLLARLALFALYLGVVLCLVATRLRGLRRHRAWATALSPASDDVAAIAARAAAVVGLRALPRLRVSDEAAAPHIIGLWRPIVVVPEMPAATGGEAERQEATLEAMLLHEFAHLRRRDTWLRAVQLSASVVFFFWPLVGWVNRRIDEYREMACDQWALNHGRLDPAEYARTLVAVARRVRERSAPIHRTALSGIVLGMAPGRGRRQLHNRVDALLRGRRDPRLGVLSGIAVAAFAVVCLGGAGNAHERMALADEECTIEPGLVEYILVTYPEADADGDGELSRDEVCAQKRLLEERGAFADEPGHAVSSTAVDGSFDPVLASLDPDKLECQACGCELDADEGVDSALQAIDKKICSVN